MSTPSPAAAPFPMPPSVPAGMRLELSRARLLPGAQEETRRCKEPGWEELRPVLLLAPRPILPLLEAWGHDGELPR